MTWPVSSRIGHPVAMHLEQGDDDSVSEADKAGVPLSEQADDAAAKLAGLYDGFDAYRTPTYNDYRDLLTAGLVILDTNVYLDLYRYNDQTRADMFTVLEQLGDCLWVPPQVMVEFWRNRESRLQDPRDRPRGLPMTWRLKAKRPSAWFVAGLIVLGYLRSRAKRWRVVCQRRSRR